MLVNTQPRSKYSYICSNAKHVQDEIESEWNKSLMPDAVADDVKLQFLNFNFDPVSSVVLQLRITSPGALKSISIYQYILIRW
jgi:hypothetical protein